MLTSPRPSQRGDVLLRARNLKMARSAHAYVRGNTLKFYSWLEQSDKVLPQGPPIWICGDCHLGNLGPLADTRGGVEIQIRDLDQTVIGNPAHDLIRLGLSLASAARSSDLPGVVTARMLEALMEGYEAALHLDPDEAAAHPPVIGEVLKQAAGRTWKQRARDRLKHVTPSIPIGKKFWAVSRSERRAIEAMCATDQIRDLATRLKGRKAGADIRLLDVAYWMKGCSSLGRLRYAVLLAIEQKGGREPDICFLDIKDAATAAAPRDPDARMPRDNAERVVAGALALSPNLGDRMAASRLLDKAVVVRELMPQDLKVEIKRLTQEEAMAVARSLAGVVGSAHARQMSAEVRSAWLDELAHNRSGRLDAPSWLWASVVELVSTHEGAYLEHCRRYALSVAA
ncbi:MAG: DUF2252 domain-containing protein [Caulobacter sp.]|nr:DUF2252 domain-containing protein [Caulobacter sp.]